MFAVALQHKPNRRRVLAAIASWRSRRSETPLEDEMNDPGPVPEPKVLTWKTEASFWSYLEQGRKVWDARIWN